MRDYLLLELQASGLRRFDVERVIDDLVLFCMLVGNDFLPCESDMTGRGRHPHVSYAHLHLCCWVHYAGIHFHALLATMC